MSFSFPRERIRLAVNAAGRSQVGSIIDAITGASPDFWRATDVQVEMSFFWGDPEENQTLLTLADYATITLDFRDPQRMTGAPLISKTVSSADFDLATTYETWTEGSRQHVKFTLTDTETAIAMNNAPQRTLTMVIWGVTNTGERVVFGATNVTITESGLTSLVLPQPAYGANLIPAGATYSGGGTYVPAGIEANRRYEWSKGANDTNIINGTETYTVNAGFVSQSTVLTLTGTPGALVTAALRHPTYLTADQVLALVSGVIKHVMVKGKTITFVSPDGTKGRVMGIGNNGQKIDQLINLA